jgi:MinD-like ATPase involved in chromosome partitioning or flagellar assembly
VATGGEGPEASLGGEAPPADARRGPDRAPVLAVWGPTGAPGRTTVATTLAAEIAGRGVEVLLVDADTYGGCVAQTLGLLDEAPGIAAACRAADQGLLDLPALSRIAPTVAPPMRVLTGMPKAERWPEVRAAALERVLELSRSLVQVVVVDCGFCLEDDEELSYDTVAPRRNEATLTSLAASDLVVAVGGADPVALQRFVRGLQELGTVPSGEPVPVVNRVRSGAVGSRPESRIADSLLRFAGLTSVRFVPDDPATLDAALLAGRSLVEHAPGSSVRAAVADLATAMLPWTVQPDQRRDRLDRRSRRAGRRRRSLRGGSSAAVGA